MMSARKANPIPASSTTSRRPSAVCGRTSPRPRVKKVVPLPYRVVPKPAPPPVATNGTPRPHEQGEAADQPGGPHPDEQEERRGAIETQVGLAALAAAPGTARGAGPQVPGRPDDQPREPRPMGHPPWQHDSLEGIQQHHTDQYDT